MGGAQRPAAARGLPLAALIETVCRALGVEAEALHGGRRRAVVCQAREGIASLWIETCRRRGRHLAPVFGPRCQPGYAAAQGRRTARAQLGRVLGTRRN